MQAIKAVVCVVVMAACSAQSGSTAMPPQNQSPTSELAPASTIAPTPTNTADVLPETMPPAEMERSCLGLADRRLEVCTAYVVNSSWTARLPYYKYARSPNQARAVAAANRLTSRYSGSALARIQAQVAQWPVGETNVGLPVIRIDSITMSNDENQATLMTREDWDIKSASGSGLFKELALRHTVRMERVPGLVLHKWVVTAIE